MKSLIHPILAVALLTTPIDAQMPANASARIDEIFANYATNASPGCIVGVGQQGKQVFAKAYGMANLEYAVPLTTESISESGSVAKQFTAAALALLHLEGRLSLDDDIRKYLPEVPDFGERITIRHLLTHTSGIRDQWTMWGLVDRGPGSEVHTIPEVLDLVKQQRELNFPTGTEYLYSNTGYTIASVIVTRVSGTPFPRFTQERLFKPLGMNHTQWRDDYRRIVPNRATAYSREGAAWVQDMPFTMVHGNGGLLTTVGDLLIWNDALGNGLLGKPELTSLLQTRGNLKNGRQIDYALGLGIGEPRPGVREISHGGSTAGYRTYLARYPDADRLSVALLCNAATANAAGMTRRVASVFLPALAAAGAPVITPAPAAERSRILGSYRHTPSEVWFVVSAVGEHVRLTGLTGDTLIFRGAGDFVTRDSARYRFEPFVGDVQRVTLTTSDGEMRTFELMRRPEVTAAQLAELSGAYYSPELRGTIRVRADSNRLFIRTSPDEESILRPLYRDGFQVGTSPATVRFVRDNSGRVKELRAFAGRARNVLFERINGV